MRSATDFEFAVIAGPDCRPWSPLPPGRHVVGRAPTAGINLDDAAVEAHHLLLAVGLDDVEVVHLTGAAPLVGDGLDPAGGRSERLRSGRRGGQTSTVCVGRSTIAVRCITRSEAEVVPPCPAPADVFPVARRFGLPDPSAGVAAEAWSSSVVVGRGTIATDPAKDPFGARLDAPVDAPISVCIRPGRAMFIVGPDDLRLALARSVLVQLVTMPATTGIRPSVEVISSRSHRWAWSRRCAGAATLRGAPPSGRAVAGRVVVFDVAGSLRLDVVGRCAAAGDAVVVVSNDDEIDLVEATDSGDAVVGVGHTGAVTVGDERDGLPDVGGRRVVGLSESEARRCLERGDPALLPVDGRDHVSTSPWPRRPDANVPRLGVRDA